MKELNEMTEILGEEKEPEPMSESEVLSFCDNEVSRGIGGNAYGDEEEDVSLAFDYYYGRRPGLSKAQVRDKEASRYVSLDVMDSVEATVAEIMPVFATDEIAFYEADNEEDEAAAKTESDLVNYIFFNECDGYGIIQNGLRDSLLHRNCSGKVYWDKRTEVIYESFENVTPMAMEQLQQPQSEDETVEIVEAIGEEVIIDTPEGQISDANYSVNLKRSTVVEKPVIESVQPENVIVSGDHTKPTLYDVRFVAHEKIETQSSLIEQGFSEKQVDKLEDYNTNVEAISRSRTSAEYDYFSSDRSTRHIRVFECYALLDVDGDGIAERRKIVYSGGQLLSDDPWPSVSIIGGCTTAIPHKYKGLSLFDRIYQIQDAKTPIMRSIIDGTRLSSNPRVGVVTGEVNIDDLLTSRTGGNVRVDSVNSVFDFPKAEVPPSSYQFLDLMDNQRKERGGSAVSTSSTAQQLQGDTAHAFERTMSAMELNNALCARTFGETYIRGIFNQMHEVLRTNVKGELSAKIGGKWVKSVPSDWQKRTDIKVSIGASNAERAKQIAALQKIIDLQGLLAEKGSLMYNEQGAYKAITKAVDLSGLPSPESYFTDPSSQEGQMKQQQQNQQKQMEMQKQTAMEQEMIKAQQGLAQAEIMKGQASLQAQQVKFENDQLKNQIDQMKALIDAKEASENLEFKREELHSKEALKVTDMELEYGEEITTTNEKTLEGE